MKTPARLLLSFCIAIAATMPAFARTTVITPTFDEMVSRAAAIFLGEVISQRSDWRVSEQGRAIVTTVTFRVERTLRGETATQRQLVFLGGRIGGLVMKVSGMPQFQTGDRDVLFVTGERNTVSPLVGFSRGRFRVVEDSARTARIHTADGKPFVTAAARAASSGLLLSPTAPAMSYAEFESIVRQKLAGAGR